jgi:hypothetical protein
MLARFFQRQIQLPALALGFYFYAANPGLQFQELQLQIGEFFAPGSVLLDPQQTQSFFQDPDLVLGEFEPVLIHRKRPLELGEQCVGKGHLELVNQRRVKGFERSKRNAQLDVITSKNDVLLTALFPLFFTRFHFFSIPIFASGAADFQPTQEQRQFLLA